MNHAAPTPIIGRCLFLALAVTLSLVLPGLVVDASAQAPPFEAVVTEADVQVRSGAGRAYYEVGTLPQGAKVVVEADLFGWYKIACPENVFCFVERKNVNMRGDGSLGVVETDNTPINAAHATKGPADSYRNLLKLNAGDTVEIIDTVNNAYKIKPPKGAYVYLPPGSIEAVSNVPAEPEPVTPTPAPAPEAEEKETPAEPEPAKIDKPEDLTPPQRAVVVAPPETPEPTPRRQADPEVVVVTPPKPAPVAVVVPEVVTPEPTTVAEAPTPGRDAPGAATEISFDSGQTPPPKPAEVDLLTDADAQVPLPDVPVQTQASNEMLRAVEVAMLPYLSLPVDEQPIAKMVRGYADAAQVAELSENDLAIVRARLTTLERNRELATALRQVDAVSAEINDGQAPAPGSDPGSAGADAVATTDPLGDAPTPGDAELAIATPAADVTPVPEPSQADVSAAAVDIPASEYDAIGILTPSTVHTGNDQPKLLRLLDPTGRRTVAYLEPNDSIDTVQMIGRIVGIVGDTVYDPTTKAKLISATRVDILSPR